VTGTGATPGQAALIGQVTAPGQAAAIGQVMVIGWDGGAPDEPARAALAAAGCVAGGRRHLAALDDLVPAGATRIALGPLEPGLAALADYLRRAGAAARAVVVASGDPGLFGVLRRLRALADGFAVDGGLAVTVLPARSSVSLAFARAGLPWEGAAVVSAHGRAGPDGDGGLARAVNVARAAPLTAVLTAPGGGPTAIGRALADDRAGTVRMFVAEDLGQPAERTGWYSPSEAAARDDWAEPNVVLVTHDEPVPAPAGPAWLLGGRRSPHRWALPEDAFTHRDSMITKAEQRAVALAALGPGPGDLVWDVGAGSGSVAVECARFGAAAVAIDRDPGALALIQANAARHQVRVDARTGTAPAALTGLPDPDAVFVGGGGPDVAAACAALARRVVVVALVALDRVRPTWTALADAGLDVSGTQLSAARIAPLPDGGPRLAATNPVILLTGTRPERP
jgi:precorrin-6Y C5,15-methyltransferase (decarboxylating)